MNNDSHSPAQTLPAETGFHRDGWSPERQRRFCEVLAACGRVDFACRAVGMTRDGAYKFRNRASGRAFALAWDAALLLARQRLVDDAYELAFEGSVERTYRNGKLETEKRKRDPRMLLHTIERLGRRDALGSQAVRAVAGEFQEFLACIEADGNGYVPPGAIGGAPRDGYASEFLEARGGWMPGREGDGIKEAGRIVGRGLLQHREHVARLAGPKG